MHSLHIYLGYGSQLLAEAASLQTRGEGDSHRTKKMGANAITLCLCLIKEHVYGRVSGTGKGSISLGEHFLPFEWNDNLGAFSHISNI